MTYTIDNAVRDITKVGVCPAPKGAVKKILERLHESIMANHATEDKGCWECQLQKREDLGATIMKERCKEAVKKDCPLSINHRCKNGTCWHKEASEAIESIT